MRGMPGDHREGTGMKSMKRNKTEESVDITDRLRQIELLEVPRVASPRVPVDDELPPLLEVERHEGRMYVAGHEPHLRPVTLLQQVRSPRHVGPEST
jgi:hypothetical protein